MGDALFLPQLCPTDLPLSDVEDGALLVLLFVFQGTVYPSLAQFMSRFAINSYSKRSIIELTFVAMHAPKRSAARSKTSPTSRLSSSHLVRECLRLSRKFCHASLHFIVLIEIVNLVNGIHKILPLPVLTICWHAGVLSAAMGNCGVSRILLSVCHCSMATTRAPPLHSSVSPSGKAHLASSSIKLIIPQHKKRQFLLLHHKHRKLLGTNGFAEQHTSLDEHTLLMSHSVSFFVTLSKQKA